MQRKLLLTLLLALSTLAAACNTVHGIGKDIERGGEKLQDASQDAQKNH
jgi:predicted small secreted protein